MELQQYYKQKSIESVRRAIYDYRLNNIYALSIPQEENISIYFGLIGLLNEIKVSNIDYEEAYKVIKLNRKGYNPFRFNYILNKPTQELDNRAFILARRREIINIIQTIINNEIII